MIKLKYSPFMGFPFTQAMQKLASIALPTHTAYSVKKLLDVMQAKRKQIQDDYLSQVVAKFAKKNEDGSLFHPEPSDTNSFDVPAESMDAYKAAEKEFAETEFTIDRAKIPLAALGSASFTAAELSLMEAVIDDGEAQATPGVPAPTPDNVASIR